ncbi:MAG TPA: sirohydrochlorin cobaltochelatase [Porphyromonadaceae bacterium]|uniref:sirohydrochlorin cobaltochelatase n=1 Tax=Limibacterium fermenti TaxID=3229863 RepID=UPI000E849247|nr:sirohydrochlorin cobaltochelatase [Porphyromonadaceae bacterium]HBK30004.1 sirohydrochlorin cobaltochelatase [Porphyromonadaceae bacterium]HBL34671.1 sirohydrochlorin cobaltochelatase [Porphyromonadaceae bacterium]HBX21437.1 sirohydrochlorin cobaltochelatase [Porphyromonadaceae bacterium]HBX44696.1 sirohydrochlorin cobaltochelatase [Porphyromonadaceae bacterium]
MKKFIVICMALIATFSVFPHDDDRYTHHDLLASLKDGEKAAVLMIHFGTTHDDTRAVTIDALNRRIQEAYPQVEVREAYSSRIVINRLRQRGVEKLNPLEALEKLHADGFTHVLIQSSNVIDGVEMDAMEKNVAEVRSLFKEIRTGDPLLYHPEDYSTVIDILTVSNDAHTAYVWVGHGTYTPTTAQYAMLDYMLKDKGHHNCFVGTVEGYPEYEQVLSQLKKSGLKKVVLVPFMFVAGDHAKNDIATDWKEALEKEGFEVEVLMKGLGQYPAIRDLYLAHLQFAATHRVEGITERKARYQGSKED